MPTLNIAKARAMGFTDEQIQQHLTSNPGIGATGVQAPQATEGGGLRDWLPTIGSIAGGVIGGGATGGAGAIPGAAIGGGAGEFLRQLLGGGVTDAGSIAKEAVLGGAGGAIGPAFKGARALVGGAKAGAKVATEKAAPNLLERMGQTMQKGVAKPKVQPSATAFDEEAKLMQQKNTMGIHGDPETQRAQSAIVYNKLKGDIQGKLALNNPVVDPNLSKSAVQSAIKATINFDAKSPAWKRAIDVRTKQVLEQKNLQEVLKYKLDLGDRLGSTFRKIEIGSPLTTQEEAALATWSALDRIITTTAPELKDITLQMSTLHKLAPGLKSAAEKGVNLPIVGKIPGISPVLQGAQDASGRALERAGAFAGKAGPIAGQTAAQVGTRAVLDSGQSEVSSQQDQAQSPTSDFAGSDTQGSKVADFMPDEMDPERVKKAFTIAMLSNPKQASTLKAIYDFGFAKPKTSAAKEKIGTQLATGNAIADQVEEAYKGVGKTGRIEGLAQRATSMAGFNPKVTAYEAIRTSMVAPLARIISTEVGVLTDRDFARADALLPKITDTPEEGRLKLAQLRDAIKRRGEAVSNTPDSNLNLEDFASLTASTQ